MPEKNDLSKAAWRKSSFSSANACVEMATLGDWVAIRDSKDGHAAVLCFTATEWQAFIRGVRAGELTVARYP